MQPLDVAGLCATPQIASAPVCLTEEPAHRVRRQARHNRSSEPSDRSQQPSSGHSTGPPALGVAVLHSGKSGGQSRSHVGGWRRRHERETVVTQARQTYGVCVSDSVGDVEDEGEDDDRNEGQVELENADEEEQDPRSGKLRVEDSGISMSTWQRCSTRGTEIC